MVKDIVTEPVGGNRIVDIIVFIGVPVICQLFWAKDKNGFVSVLVVFDDCERRESFTETDAVR